MDKALVCLEEDISKQEVTDSHAAKAFDDTKISPGAAVWAAAVCLNPTADEGWSGGRARYPNILLCHESFACRRSLQSSAKGPWLCVAKCASDCFWLGFLESVCFHSCIKSMHSFFNNPTTVSVLHPSSTQVLLFLAKCRCSSMGSRSGLSRPGLCKPI